MKNLGIVLNVYILACLSVIDTDWYARVYPIIDTIDTIPFLFAMGYFPFVYKKLSGFQLTCFIAVFFALVFKWLDYEYLNSEYHVYIMWHMIINGIFPVLALLYKVKGVEDENN
jgi:hypothetical protein